METTTAIRSLRALSALSSDPKEDPILHAVVISSMAEPAPNVYTECLDDYTSPVDLRTLPFALGGVAAALVTDSYAVPLIGGFMGVLLMKLLSNRCLGVHHAIYDVLAPVATFGLVHGLQGHGWQMRVSKT